MNRLLLLEDDLSLISGLTFAFEKRGLSLDAARTFQEADDLWADGKYDLLVLDIKKHGRVVLIRTKLLQFERNMIQ